MAKTLSMTIEIPGVEVWVNYNSVNLRVTTVQWTLPQSGITAWVRIWNSGSLAYDRTISGPASDTENVPGNHTVVLVDDGILSPHYDLPNNLTWTINIETVT